MCIFLFHLNTALLDGSPRWNGFADAKLFLATIDNLGKVGRSLLSFAVMTIKPHVVAVTAGNVYIFTIDEVVIDFSFETYTTSYFVGFENSERFVI